MSPKDLTSFRFESMEKSIEEIKLNLKEHTRSEEDFQRDLLDRLDTLNGKFAGKWVEKFLIGLLSLVGTIVITALLALILK